MEDSQKDSAPLVVVTGMLIIALVLTYLSNKPHIAKYFFIAAGTLGLGFVVSNFFTTWFMKLWFGLAMVLGYINTRVLLSIVFYIFLFPLALLSRLFKKDEMMLKEQSNSTFRERNHTYQKKDLENPW